MPIYPEPCTTSGRRTDTMRDCKYCDSTGKLYLQNSAYYLGHPEYVPCPDCTCTNCGGPLDERAAMTSKDGAHKFCGKCAAFSDALDIGNPHVSRTFLYDDGKGGAQSWMGGILGTITHKRKPEWSPGRPRSFAPVTYRVRMLDGSMWYGTGPSENGTYIRLRRMKSHAR